MKEDVLEQIVEDYLQSRGYFTRHNLKFRPAATHPDFKAAEDAVHSDIDVIGVNPQLEGPDRVWVVSCKAWQEGFSTQSKLKELRGELKGGKRAFWRHVRELWSPKWSEAFRDEVQAATGQRDFKYSIAVTKLTGKWSLEDANREWSTDPTIASNMRGCTVGFMTLADMWHEVRGGVGTTMANSEIGRIAQLLNAAEL